MIATPVSSSPVMIARSIGAAPRQRGSSDGWTLSMKCSLSSGSLSSAPNAQTATASGFSAAIRARASSLLTLSGWSTAMPSSRAFSATGGGVRRRPRPAGRSGRVTTSEGRCGEAASRSSTAATNSLVPRKTVLTWLDRWPARPLASGSRMPGADRRTGTVAARAPPARTPVVLAGPGGWRLAPRDGGERAWGSPVQPLGRAVLRFAQGPHRLLALVARGAVEDEHAVEVVDLVLDDARLEPAGLDLDRLAVLVARADADVDRALDVDDHAGQRQAPLLHDLGLLAAPLDDRVDERVDWALGLDAVDEDAVEGADLGGRQADPDGLVHEPAHARDLLAQRVVEGVDLARPRAQDGVAELADLAQRGLATRALLLGQRRGRRGLFLDDLLLLGHGSEVTAATAGPRRR